MLTAEVVRNQGITFNQINPYGYLHKYVNNIVTTVNRNWVYDIECYTDFFSVTFLPMDLSKQVIKKYARADMYNNISAMTKTLQNLDIHIFVIHSGGNGVALKHFITTNCDILTGYNNDGYDDPMLSFFLSLGTKKITEGVYNKMVLDNNYNLIPQITTLTQELKGFSDKVINRELEYSELKVFKKFAYFPKKPTSLDVMKVNGLDKLRISLKKCAITLKWYRVEDLPYKPNSLIATPQGIIEGSIFNMLTYNINDVLITKLGFNSSKGEFAMRFGISKQFDVNVLSLSRSSAGDKILEKHYIDMSGKNTYQLKARISKRSAVSLVDVIDSTISFETDTFKELHKTLLRTTVYAKGHPKYAAFERNIIFDNHEYKLALGGLHSVDRPIMFASTPNIAYRDADVTSYYPNLLINLLICPSNLDHNIFLTIVKIMLDERVKAKKLAKDKSQSNIVKETNGYINDGLKISVNSIFGKLGYEKGWLYDLRAMYKTTVNGQLMLLKLIEMLYLKGIHTISANTDGIICRIPLEKEEIYLKTCKQWERMFRLSLEYNDYDRYLATSVNDYIAVTKNGDIKRKGDFVNKVVLNKGYSQPVVAKALNEYFINGGDINEFINNCNNIHDFVYTQKIGKDMELHRMWVTDGIVHTDLLQKTDRYYVSNSGSALYKQYLPDSPKYRDKKSHKVKTLAIKKGQYVEVINDITYNQKYPNLHRGFYIKEAFNILNKARLLDYKQLKGTKKKSGISGTLFDNI